MTTWSSNDWPVEWAANPFTPRLSASIIVPAYRNQAQLDAVIAGLQLQDYPTELFEVVVADDGSEPPLQPQSIPGVSVETVWQEDSGYRLSAARNHGALKAQGDILVFLDSDMIPDPGWLTAHMRVHHRCGWALVCGFRRHVETEVLDAHRILESGGPQPELTGAEYREPLWLIRFWHEHDDGRLRSDRVWRVTSGGNLSVPTSLFLSIGGFDEDLFTEWGGEDNDFGYRAYQSGVMVIPIRDALAWHLGWGTSASDTSGEMRRRTTRLLSLRIPDPGLPRATGVIPHVPDLWVRFEGDYEDLEQLIRFAERAASTRTTTFVSIQGKARAITLDSARAAFAQDTRIHIGPHDEVPDSWRYAPVHLETQTADWTTDQLDSVVFLVKEGEHAGLHVLDEDGSTSTARLTRIVGQIRAGLMGEDQAAKKYPFRWISRLGLSD